MELVQPTAEAEAPVAEAPVAAAPVAEAPVAEAPVTEAPVVARPFTPEPAAPTIEELQARAAAAMQALAERRQLVLYKSPLVIVAPYLSPTLRGQQKEAVAHAIDCLTGTRDPDCTACVLDVVMGFGKTLVSLAVLDALFRAGMCKHALVLCPPTLKAEWADEAASWLRPAGVQYIVLHALPDLSAYLSATRAVLIAGHGQFASVRVAFAREGCSLDLELYSNTYIDCLI